MNESDRRACRPVAAAAVVGLVVSIGAIAWGLGRVEHPGRVVMARMGGARFHGLGDGVLQHASNDCGPAALAHCLRRLGRQAPYPDPESGVRLGPRGCSLGELAEEASRLGWSVVVRRIEPPELAAVVPPAILHLRPGHFVVWEGSDREGRWAGHDPALGRVSWSPRSLAARWGGEILHGDGPPGRAPGRDSGPIGRSPVK